MSKHPIDCGCPDCLIQDGRMRDAAATQCHVDSAMYGALGAASPGADPWVHRSARMSCATCMWYVGKAKTPMAAAGLVPATKPVGRCRRHAPTMSGYPVVFEADWCGDHKLDENAPAL